MPHLPAQERRGHSGGQKFKDFSQRHIFSQLSYNDAGRVDPRPARVQECPESNLVRTPHRHVVKDGLAPKSLKTSTLRDGTKGGWRETEVMDKVLYKAETGRSASGAHNGKSE